MRLGRVQQLSGGECRCWWRREWSIKHRWDGCGRRRVVPNRSGELVKGLVQKGKLNPDATARLHQAAPSSVQKVKAKEKLKLEYAVANCTFKPELCSGESSHQSREGRLEERNEGKIEAMMTNEEESLLPQPSPPLPHFNCALSSDEPMNQPTNASSTSRGE